ncbi:hypothetical protein C0058_28555 [Pseudomonas sp. NC02]|nr:hypothetical protein C0058_28555 [Pseudomonas sp. NC02]
MVANRRGRVSSKCGSGPGWERPCSRRRSVSHRTGQLIQRIREQARSHSSRLPHGSCSVRRSAYQDTRLALTSFACSSAWYEERTSGPEATFLKPIL